jgi:protein-S-isoprenylcysteine O-methyltransferase Ste14
MALNSRTVAWILRIGSCAFWLLIGVRMAASRSGSASTDRSGSADALREPISSPGTWTIFWVTCLSMVANSALLLLWSKSPAFVGPALLPRSLALQRLGIGLMASGLGLMAWAYLVFRSFRLLPKIEAGHELCEDGPFAWLRHPIYCGINLFYLGTFFLAPHLWLLVQVVVNAVAFDARARHEERVLTQAFGDQYRRYTARTWRWVPCLY